MRLNIRARIVSLGIWRLPMTRIWETISCCAHAETARRQQKKEKHCSVRRMERRKLWLSWIGELAPPRSTGKICTPSLQEIRPSVSKRRLYGSEAADPNSAIRFGARL